MTPTKSKKKAASKAGRRPVPGLCTNCGCSHLETTQWRWDDSGDYGKANMRMCSACGLYRKNNGKQRKPGASQSSQSPAADSGQSSSSYSSASPSSSSVAPSSSSSSGYGAPAFVSSPVSYDSSFPSPAFPHPALPDLNERVLPKLKLTLGSAVLLCSISPQWAGSSTDLDEQDIVLESSADRDEVVVDEAMGDGEARRAAEALLEIAGRGESEVPPSPSVPAPTVPESPAPARWSNRFRLLDTRPSHLFGRPQRPAVALLPPTVQRYALAAGISRGFGSTLAPILAQSRPTGQLPSFRDLRLD